MNEARTKTALIEIETASFLSLLNRALNTLEPAYWPGWASTVEGNIQHTDKLVLQVQREIPPPKVQPDNFEVKKNDGREAF